MATYHIIVFGKNKDLGKVAIARAKELGWKVTEWVERHLITGLDRLTDICLNPDGECNTWSSNRDYSNMRVGDKVDSYNFDAIIADLYKFFHTDEYRRKPTVVKVPLNQEYTAEVSKNTIKVGCQEFSVEKLRELLTAAESLA